MGKLGIRRSVAGTVGFVLLAIATLPGVVGRAVAQDRDVDPIAYIIAVGVDEYDRGYGSFAGAVRDAQAFADSLSRLIRPAVDSVATTVLLDSDASRSGIQRAMRAVADRSDEDDILVLFFAGHGRQILVDSTAEHFLVLPGTTADGEDPLQEHRQRSLSARLLNTWMNVVPAGNKMLVIDAAHGQRFFWELRTLVEEQAIREQNYDLLAGNLAVFAFDDLAPELHLPDGRVHGPLTYTMLEGMKTLSSEGDQVGTVLELGEFVRDNFQRFIDDFGNGSFATSARFYLQGDYFPLVASSVDSTARRARSLFGHGGPKLPRPVNLSSGIDVHSSQPLFFAVPEIEITLTGRVNTDVVEVEVNGRRVEPEFSGVFRAPLSRTALSDTVYVTARTETGWETQYALEPQVAMRGGKPAHSESQAPVPTRTGRDYALLFATSRYDNWSDLVNPSFDAAAVAEELETSYGFEVTLVENATRSEMLDSLNAFAGRPYQDDDQLLVYFAGHGSYDETYIQDGYVVASDSQPEANDQYKDSVVQYNFLRRRLANATSNHVLLLLDVCYGGTFDDRIGEWGIRGEEEIYEDAAVNELVRRKMAYRTRRYVTSGGKTRVPDGLPGEHTPFVRRLLEAMRSYGGVDGVLTLAEVLAAVETVSPEPRSGEFEHNEPGSDFLFILK